MSEDKNQVGIDISDAEFKEIVKKVENKKELSETEKGKIKRQIASLSNYDQELSKIIIPKGDKKVIFTEGKKQLLHDNGEFFEISSTDSTEAKRKLTDKEAHDMFISYYIKNILNPLIELKRNEEINISKVKLEDFEKQKNSDIINTRISKKDKKSKDEDSLEI